MESEKTGLHEHLKSGECKKTCKGDEKQAEKKKASLTVPDSLRRK